MNQGDLTHASFFSGAGGLDLGLERAGWRTVSFSEIDPYASAVLARHWPHVPNLGDIIGLADGVRLAAGALGVRPVDQRDDAGQHDQGDGGAWQRALLWTAGFPCQDLSVAGKRAGLAGERSGLAFAFLDLVGRYRPPAIILENVPGLLSSHRGRDFFALQRRMAELGYVGAYRVLDARYFGVPQRRRRVFIVALDAGRGAAADDAAEVLSVGSRCDRHPATGGEARAGTAASTARGTDDAGFYNATPAFGGREPGDAAGTLSARDYKSANHLISPSPDPSGVRAPHGLAGRVDDRQELAPTLTAPDTRHRVEDGRRQDGSRRDRIPVVVAALDTKRGGADDSEAQAGHLIPVPFVKRGRAQTADDGETWGEGDVAPTLNGFDVGDTRTTAAILGTAEADDPLLPDGLDSHRYRCCGNGVVAPVAEFIGERLAAWVRAAAQPAQTPASG